MEPGSESGLCDSRNVKCNEHHDWSCKRGLDIVCDSMKISKCMGGIYPKSISVTFWNQWCERQSHISGIRTVFGLGIVTEVQKVVSVKIHLFHIMDLYAEFSWLRLQPSVLVLLAPRFFILFLLSPSLFSVLLSCYLVPLPMVQ